VWDGCLSSSWRDETAALKVVELGPAAAPVRVPGRFSPHSAATALWSRFEVLLAAVAVLRSCVAGAGVWPLATRAGW
jgi:hypothetical protein